MANSLARALDMLLDLQHSVDRARTSTWPGLATTGRGAFPPVNVFSEDDAVVLVAELPGLSRDDVDVQVHGDQVRLKGTKQIDYGDDISLHRRERRAGSFDRTFSVPFQIDQDHVQANHRNGILAVHLPRAEQDKPRTIKVQ